VIEGLKFQMSNSRHRESLLQYQRPMLEDGEIEFETWYEPDAYEVFPTLGRTALIFKPDGVFRHRMTNSPYETDGLAIDNLEPLAISPVSLVPKDWNHVRIVLEGELLRLYVNREEVASLTIDEPSVERHFGLFRYANLTQCRVRNVLYRGQWPKQLPPPESQFLAP
ncbi:MAG: DUF1583 domain-containing protein, partial [Pirellulaceae bacterium]|nr:DUF1583 domain-containing protein [Pirellulaceae bacterium]